MREFKKYNIRKMRARAGWQATWAMRQRFSMGYRRLAGEVGL